MKTGQTSILILHMFIYRQAKSRTPFPSRKSRCGTLCSIKVQQEASVAVNPPFPLTTCGHLRFALLASQALMNGTRQPHLLIKHEVTETCCLWTRDRARAAAASRITRRREKWTRVRASTKALIDEYLSSPTSACPLLPISDSWAFLDTSSHLGWCQLSDNGQREGELRISHIWDICRGSEKRRRKSFTLCGKSGTFPAYTWTIISCQWF